MSGRATRHRRRVRDRGPNHAADLGGRHRYINRHLSWLDFDTRVLELAEDSARALLERAKFLAISSSNLDEFFQVRVGGLIEQRRAGVAALSPDGMTVDEQLSEIQRRAIDLTARQMRAFRAIVERLGEVGLRFSNYGSLDLGDRENVDSVFEERIFPVLTPLAVDPAHPFPYISDLSLNLAVVVGAPRGSEQRIARVKVPPLLPRFVVMPDGERFVPVEQVIAAHLDRLFPGMRVIGQYPFRVTRNADPALEEEEAEDLRTAVQEYLRRRRRSPQVVRLEIDDTMSEEVKRLLMRELELSGEDVYTVAGPLDLSGLWGLYELNRPDLKERLPAPVIPPALAKPPGRRGRGRHLPGDRRRRRPRPPSVRVLREQRRGLRRPGGERSRRARHQADAVPDLGSGQPDRPLADPRRRVRQAGGRARRAEGALRRGGEHHLGGRAREGRRPRRLRRRRPQDARQGHAGRPAHRHGIRRYCHMGTGQLQPDRPPASTRTSACSRPTRSSART